MSKFILHRGYTFNTLSVWPPWSWLIAMGEKQYETRGWYPHKNVPKYLAIHSAQHWTSVEQTIHQAFMRHYPHMQWPESKPLGAVLCICQLRMIHQTEKIRGQLMRQELAFGDYSDGRFAWELEVVHVFEQPIPARGGQKLWKWTYQGEA